jgi:hypothetical protein
MGELLSIEGKTRPAEINAGIIETLEDWLADARNGDIKSLLMVRVDVDDSFIISIPANDCTLQLLGAVEFAKHDLIAGHD